MGQLLGTDAAIGAGRRRKYDPHPITERFSLLTAYPLARSVSPIAGGAQRTHGAEPRRDQREQLGRDRHQAS